MNVLQNDRDSPGVELVCEAYETGPVAQNVSRVHDHLGKSRDGHPVNGLERSHRSGRAN